ncbi:MAG: hypothetical protein WCP99_00440 [Burkholderiales bacterium]
MTQNYEIAPLACEAYVGTTGHLIRLRGLSSLLVLIAQKLWMGASGLMTTVLVATCLTSELQGWYYALLSLAATYTLFDLGFSNVLIGLVSKYAHGARSIDGGNIDGKGANSLRALVEKSLRLYRYLAVGYFVVMIPAGLLFFSGRAEHEGLQWEQWAVAWLGLGFVTAVSLTMTPFLAIVEGSGRVKEVALVRLIHGVAGSLFCWIVLWNGGGLWAAMMTPAFGVIVMSLWLKRRFPTLPVTRFDRSQLSIRWRTDVWPQQWRFGMGWTASYLLTQIYTPILFYYSGTVAAGQMGLSFSIANLLAVVAHVWITRHVPAMAHAATGKDWNTLDRLFKGDLKQSLVFFLFGSIVLCAMVQLIEGTSYGNRILPFWPFAGLLCISLINHVTGALAAQLRAFQREPLVKIVVLGAIAIVPLAVWVAPSHGAAGVIAVIISVQAGFVLPAVVFVWKRCQVTFRGQSMSCITTP